MSTVNNYRMSSIVSAGVFIIFLGLLISGCVQKEPVGVNGSMSLQNETLPIDQDTCCSIVPYFKVQSGKVDEFKALGLKFIEATQKEPGCLYYGFSYNQNVAHCREGYANAEALLAHLDNVGPILQEALKISELTSLEIHGSKAELAKLREPLAAFKPQFFTLEYGFRR